MGRSISVFLADDNLIVREGVRALLRFQPDIDVVGVAGDYHELVARASEAAANVVVTDIRMPPTFQREGIDAAIEIRKRHPGTGIVILSQYDDPEYAISLLSEGAAGCAYLLKDRVAEDDELANAVRAVATGGSMLDARIAQALVDPVTAAGGISECDEELLGLIAKGRPMKAIAVAQGTTAADVADQVEKLFLTPGPRGERRRCQRLASASPAPSGHRRSRGAGRVAQPAAARRRRRPGPASRWPDRADRGNWWSRY